MGAIPPKYFLLKQVIQVRVYFFNLFYGSDILTFEYVQVSLLHYGSKRSIIV